MKIVRLLIQNNRHLQKKFSLDNDLLKLLFKSKSFTYSSGKIGIIFLVTVCCHGDLEIVSNSTHTLILLTFDRTLSDPDFQQQTFSVDSLLTKK